MDRVRFGRALGYGARHAAKSLVKAVDAAASPNPRAAANSGAAAATSAAAAAAKGSPATGQPAGRPAAQAPEANQVSHQASRQEFYARGAAQRVAQTRAGVSHGRAQAGHLRRTVWAPLANFTGVVGLQVSGTFFAVVAAFLSQGLWKARSAVHLGLHLSPYLGVHLGLSSPAAGKFYLHAVAFVLFAYFAVSSFVRAHLKQRR